MNAIGKTKMQTTTQGKLDHADELIKKLNKELDFLKFLSREERLTLPRITRINRVKVEQAASQENISNSNHSLIPLNNSLHYYDRLNGIIKELQSITERLKSTKLIIGANIYERGKTILKSQKDSEPACEELFFPLQPNAPTPLFRKSKKVNRNECIPIADLVGEK